MPSVLPDLHIGGFYLNSHRDFQLGIFLQISSKMLGRIERLLGISLVSSAYENEGVNPASPSKGDGGILDSTSASALLHAMLKQNDLGYFKEVDGGAASVKQTLDDMKEALKRIA
ncbi:hypothetical protein BO78DRAFT_323477 [Aspergillus sclerotiicarbonarius CBS 121057]|uniref:Uncharacterized protein n=1 Tax=Aspergillus sclerotiicarbonarius (strain CBS 121057 / IBT 28362) TaxID=1448318 RepID=A0A319FAU1_ASPSB|nr:hypothetical protein BO78DRAFT_323477 [Aspergillus sclerotiicarbonarius CBS 121057]